jgi:EAL domain-containing protein (putative c-di-GMP-specific phosphodiesterase class I)
LSGLAQIPFTELKIDRSFVHGVCERDNVQIMLRSALEMAAELGLVTVAEGVESKQELAARESGLHVRAGLVVRKGNASGGACGLDPAIRARLIPEQASPDPHHSDQ